MLNCGTGIASSQPVELDLQGVTFINVATPIDAISVTDAVISRTKVINDPKLKDAKGVERAIYPRGPALPCFCPSCKSVFPSRNYDFRGAGKFKSWDNEEPCPNCHHPHAKLSEGVFNLVAETASIITAPDITYVMFQQLSAILSEVKSSRMSPEMALQKAFDIAPALKPLAEKATEWEGAKYNKVMLFLAVFSIVVAVIMGVPAWIDLWEKHNTPPNYNDTVRQSLETIENKYLNSSINHESFNGMSQNDLGGQAIHESRLELRAPQPFTVGTPQLQPRPDIIHRGKNRHERRKEAISRAKPSKR